MKEERKKVVYVVIEQGKENTFDYEDIYHDSKVVYIYCHDVNTSDVFKTTPRCQLFDYHPLPDRITSRIDLEAIIYQQNDMVRAVLADQNNTVIIWAFPLKAAHLGVYVLFIHSLEIRHKHLIFHLNPKEMEQLHKLTAFETLNKSTTGKILLTTTLPIMN